MCERGERGRVLRGALPPHFDIPFLWSCGWREKLPIQSLKRGQTKGPCSKLWTAEPMMPRVKLGLGGGRGLPPDPPPPNRTPPENGFRCAAGRASRFKISEPRLEIRAPRLKTRAPWFQIIASRLKLRASRLKIRASPTAQPRPTSSELHKDH